MYLIRESIASQSVVLSRTQSQSWVREPLAKVQSLCDFVKVQSRRVRFRPSRYNPSAMRIAEWAPSPSAAEHVLSSCTVLRPNGRARVSSVSSSCESSAAGASRTSWQHTAATPRSKTRERRQCTCGEEGAVLSTCMREDARATPVHLQRRSRGRSRCRRRRRHLLHSRFGDVPLQGAAVLGDEFGLRVRIAVGDVNAPLLARLQRCSAVSAAERALQPAERPSPWVSFCNPGSSALISAHQRSSALISAHQRSSALNTCKRAASVQYGSGTKAAISRWRCTTKPRAGVWHGPKLIVVFASRLIRSLTDCVK